MNLIPPVPLFPIKAAAGKTGALVIVALLGLALYATAKHKDTPPKR